MVHTKSLVDKVRGALMRGTSVAVIGWKESNHDKMTRSYREQGRVVFYEKCPRDIGASVGLIFFTKFNGRPIYHRMKKIAHPSVVQNGEIKRVFKQCKDLLLAPKVLRRETIVVVEQPKPQPASIPVVVTTVNPTVEEPKEVRMAEVMVTSTETNMQKFVRLFLEKSKLSTDGMVGKMTLGDIRRECGLDDWSNTKLVTEGWIMPVIGEGRKQVGNYKPSEKMLGAKTVESEPNDPLSRAGRLISEESAVEMAILETEERLEQLKKKLGQIAEAKSLVDQLNKLVG